MCRLLQCRTATGVLDRELRLLEDCERERWVHSRFPLGAGQLSAVAANWQNRGTGEDDASATGAGVACCAAFRSVMLSIPAVTSGGIGESGDGGGQIDAAHFRNSTG